MSLPRLIAPLAKAGFARKKRKGAGRARAFMYNKFSYLLLEKILGVDNVKDRMLNTVSGAVRF